jgi:hypothetical protein
MRELFTIMVACRRFSVFLSVILAQAAHAATNDQYLLRLQKVTGCTNGLWDLHGLWPQWGESCPGPAFEESELDAILPDLDKYWPSCQEANEPFWSHEWEPVGLVCRALLCTCMYPFPCIAQRFFSSLLTAHYCFA